MDMYSDLPSTFCKVSVIGLLISESKSDVHTLRCFTEVSYFQIQMTISQYSPNIRIASFPVMRKRRITIKIKIMLNNAEVGGVYQ